MVAIPFSSGLCSFRFHVRGFHGRHGRNPFFIRSVFVRKGLTLHEAENGRNPFFIRSVFVLSWYQRTPTHVVGVAIPFSSGLCSFNWWRAGRRGRKSRNPFFIRSVFVPLQALNAVTSLPSQSLFHQVCVRSDTLLSVLNSSIKSQSLFHQVCVRS